VPGCVRDCRDSFSAGKHYHTPGSKCVEGGTVPRGLRVSILDLGPLFWLRDDSDPSPFLVKRVVDVVCDIW